MNYSRKTRPSLKRIFKGALFRFLPIALPVWIMIWIFYAAEVRKVTENLASNEARADAPSSSTFGKSELVFGR